MEIEKIKQYLINQYNLEVFHLEQADCGAGSMTCFADTSDGKLVVKYPEDNDMNHLELEPALCGFLVEKGIPACRFLKNKDGQYISVDETGRRFLVQQFLSGKTYGYHEAPNWLMKEGALMLGRIHTVLEQYETLPEGIGEGFFQWRTPKSTLQGYEDTLWEFQEISRKDRNEIASNMKILANFPNYQFDLSRLTCKNTHGYYIISQLLCEKHSIHAVIDWTSACVHPVVWEIMRFYVFASPLCRDGQIDITDFTEYVKCYLKYGTLTPYDLENMGNVFYYFLAVCNFYEQYYASSSANREILLQQAELSAKLMRWFSIHDGELSDALRKM